MTERLEAVSGCMFSGKTDELERLVRREQVARIKTQIFKPIIDDRYGKPDKVVSHSGKEMDATPINDSSELLAKLEPGVTFVAIDEVQFFDKGIINVIDRLLGSDIKVLVVGLPLDFRGEPFGPMPILLAKADDITKLTALCTFIDDAGEQCNELATRTQRFVNGKPANYHDPIVQIGAAESYGARCPTHHIVPGRPNK